jgi:hypothetical protein
MPAGAWSRSRARGPPSTVANEPLETRSVLALDADRCVDGKPTRPLPCAHVRRGGGVQKANRVCVGLAETVRLAEERDLLRVPRNAAFRHGGQEHRACQPDP